MDPPTYCPRFEARPLETASLLSTALPIVTKGLSLGAGEEAAILSSLPGLDRRTVTARSVLLSVAGAMAAGGGAAALSGTLPQGRNGVGIEGQLRGLSGVRYLQMLQLRRSCTGARLRYENGELADDESAAILRIADNRSLAGGSTALPVYEAARMLRRMPAAIGAASRGETAVYFPLQLTHDSTGNLKRLVLYPVMVQAAAAPQSAKGTSLLQVLAMIFSKSDQGSEAVARSMANDTTDIPTGATPMVDMAVEAQRDQVFSQLRVLIASQLVDPEGGVLIQHPSKGKLRVLFYVANRAIDGPEQRKGQVRATA